MTTPETPEFSRLVPLPRHDGGEAVYPITANAAERAALAARLDLVALDGLTAEVRLSYDAAGTRLAAHLAADVQQMCGVTLEPFRSRIEDDFTVIYRQDAPNDELIDALAEDYEILEGSEIDIGEAVAQQLSLSLDPFPRAPGAEIEGFTADSAEIPAAEEPKASPFAALARLAKK